MLPVDPHASKLFSKDVGHLTHRLGIRRQHHTYQNIGVSRIRIVVRHGSSLPSP